MVGFCKFTVVIGHSRRSTGSYFISDLLFYKYGQFLQGGPLGHQLGWGRQTWAAYGWSACSDIGDRNKVVKSNCI